MKQRRKVRKARPSGKGSKRTGGPVADLERPGDDGRFHILEKPNAAFGPVLPIVETVFFSKIGHTFGPASQWPGQPTQYVVQDFVLDQTGASHADGKMAATKAFDLTTTTRYRFNVYPKDRAKRIKVVPPSGETVFIGLDVGRRYVNAASDFANSYTPHTFFEDLGG